MTPSRGCKICYRMIFNNCGGKTNRGCKICYVTFSNYEGKINNWRTITGIWQQILIFCGTKSHSYVSPAIGIYLLDFVLTTQFHKIQDIINCMLHLHGGSVDKGKCIYRCLSLVPVWNPKQIGQFVFHVGLYWDPNNVIHIAHSYGPNINSVLPGPWQPLLAISWQQWKWKMAASINHGPLGNCFWC